MKKTTKNLDKSSTKINKKKEEKKGDYHVILKFNDEVHEGNTDNLEEFILNAAPERLKTNVTIQVTKNGKSTDRFLSLQNGNQVFLSKIHRENFIKQILL